jgi:hypothetical protein
VFVIGNVWWQAFVGRVSAAISAALHSTLLPLHSTARYILVTAADRYALLVGSKPIGLEVNADKIKYMVMSWEQNAGRSHNIKIDNSFIQTEEGFKIWEKH